MDNLFLQMKRAIEACDTIDQLEKIRVQYLGRKGIITLKLRELKDKTEQEKRQEGPELQNLKRKATDAIQEKEQQLLKAATLPDIDMSAPPLGLKLLGRLHPVTQFEQRIWKIFQKYNFEIVQSPEIETDFFNFQALNIPTEHPARDMQDTFYTNQMTESGEPMVLRAHTTTIQGRYMKNHTPPIRLINTGKCFRRDADLTHTPMFHQFDGFWIDEAITMADLKGLLENAVGELLEEKIVSRFRVSYFPFVEPGAEFDIRCALCEGKGCATCKRTGWVELGGCGMIHPKVLHNFGLSPEKYQGIAWGFGIERPFMMKYRIHDLRRFFENDLRFLSQF